MPCINRYIFKLDFETLLFRRVMDVSI